ncbi:hypothetical protein EG329_009908 [Mollisiaceae sp. DMI_Dod_QoI]|nr:hypothetical protein EG329_009908 [Helotiales sp. DMI_Dod_QoI]
MPHVATQWQTGQYQRGSYDSRLSTGHLRKSSEYLRPIAIPPPRPGHRHPGVVRQSPSMSFLGSPENEKWDFGSIRHIRQYSFDTTTPVSAVDSVFELPSASSYDSPSSSTHSSFVAELEDTSPLAVRSQKPNVVKPHAVSHSSMEFKSTEMTSRAVIKVVDETIAAIEHSNRKLLSRAVAAEETAKHLREQNSQLELKVQHCSHNHRPKTAPSQSSNRARPHHRPSPSVSDNHDPTPLSTFNATIDKLVLPSKRDSRPREPPPYPPLQTPVSQTASTPISTSPYIDLASNRMSITGFPTPLTQPRRPRPSPLQHRSHCYSNSFSHSHSLSHLSISAPIPGSVTRHEVTYEGTPISSSQRAKNISLEEARRRAKPLPPLGPMSPSILKGVVEIGTPKGIDEFGRELRFEESKDVEKKKRGFSGLFKWSKKDKENVF